MVLWSVGALGFDDFAGFEKMVILRFFNFWVCVLRSEFVLVKSCVCFLRKKEKENVK